MTQEMRESAFRPSFPNPSVWTDELVAQRRAEFMAFEKTQAGRAEEAAFNKEYSAHEMRRELTGWRLQELKRCLEALSGWPASALVSELYDTDPEFAASLRGVLGASFEYPDFAHRTVEQVVRAGERALRSKESRIEAEVIAAIKGSVHEWDPAKSQVLQGKVMAITHEHLVLSLGRRAAILALCDLDQVPKQGTMVEIAWEQGRGALVPQPAVQASIGR